MIINNFKLIKCQKSVVSDFSSDSKLLMFTLVIAYINFYSGKRPNAPYKTDGTYYNE